MMQTFNFNGDPDFARLAARALNSAEAVGSVFTVDQWLARAQVFATLAVASAIAGDTSSAEAMVRFETLRDA